MPSKPTALLLTGLNNMHLGTRQATLYVPGTLLPLIREERSDRTALCSMPALEGICSTSYQPWFAWGLPHGPISTVDFYSVFACLALTFGLLKSRSLSSAHICCPSNPIAKLFFHTLFCVIFSINASSVAKIIILHSCCPTARGDEKHHRRNSFLAPFLVYGHTGSSHQN